MYQFSNKLKISAIALMVIGLIGIIISFVSAPSTESEVKDILANNAGHGHHDTHVIAKESHTETKHEVVAPTHDEAHVHEVHVNETHGEVVLHESNEQSEAHHNVADEVSNHVEVIEAHTTNTHVKNEDHGAHANGDHGDHHIAHVLSQMKNRPWASFYVALFFFTFLTLVVFAFLNINRVAQAGWSIVLFRVMEGISGVLPYISVIFLGFIVLTAFGANHLFMWMGEGVTDVESENFDAIIANKSAWLNVPRWLVCSVIYLAGWNIFRYFNRKFSLAQDTANDLTNYNKNYKVGVAFLGFFIFTESMSVWDWIMGIDPHWFSTLFGWYVLATFLASAITVIAMVTVYLKSKGYLEIVNNSHIHDLAKFMFGFSIFWTYLWFAQFMLIWYSNMPEETVYYIQRFDEYKILI